MTESVTGHWRLGRDPRAAGSRVSPGGLVRLHVLMALRTWAGSGVARSFELIERRDGPSHLDVVLAAALDDKAADGDLRRELSLRGLARQRIVVQIEPASGPAVAGADDELPVPRLDLRSLLERTRSMMRAPSRA